MTKSNFNTFAGKFGVPALILATVLGLAACATAFIQSLGKETVTSYLAVVGDPENGPVAQPSQTADGAIATTVKVRASSAMPKSDEERKAGWSKE